MVLSKNCLIFTVLCLFVSANSFAQTASGAENYLSAAARPGEDALGLLDRYGLAAYSCNVSHFLEINELENNRLKAGTLYKLPVLVVVYNGKSIRTTLKIDDWKTAKRIEEYNKSAQRKALRPDYFVENKRLWVPWHEINCAESDLPKTAAASIGAIKKERVRDKSRPMPNVVMGGEKDRDGNRIFPIFGPGHQKTPLLNRKMKGKVFYLISGHGGPDVGAQGKRAGHTLCEDEYAYDVTLRLLRLLLSHGATAYMIVRDPNDGIRDGSYLKCDKDEEVWGGLNIPYDQKERLRQRTDIINTLTEKHLKVGQADQTILEIHIDSRSHDKKQDVFFYYRPNSDPSLALAEHIHQTFAAKYRKAQGRGYSGTVSSRQLFTLKETYTPRAVYIELGNIQNDWDQQRLVIQNNRQAIANWLCHALLTQ
ncbi:MAG: N-acetylmuramoyl-L-alanine amidase [Saprospiraceae bacterium]|nr:N-acetylmuramoyl-L-alanine amidase [Saprospiraceae bacterium]